MARPPFDMLRAAFWMLTALIGVELLATSLLIAGCVWVAFVDRAEPLGACQQVGTQIREIWAEALAAILALLLASKSGPPPPE